MPGKKLSNKKNYAAHKQWEESKKASNAKRKQIWVDSTLNGESEFEPEDITEETLPMYVSAHWEHYASVGSL